MKKIIKIWLTLVCIGIFSALYFSGKATIKLLKYSRLNGVALAQVSKWKILEVGPDEYAISADFQFSYRQEKFEGNYTFSLPYYLNAYAAQSAVERMEKKLWEVYFDPDNPHSYALQKFFPYKDCFQAFLAIAVTFYFYFLKGFFRQYAKGQL